MKDQKVKKNLEKEREFVGVFGRKLRSLREKNGINRSEAAKLIEVSPSTLQAWEDDSGRLPNAWDLQKIASAYSVDVKDLYSDEVSEVKLSAIKDAFDNPIDIDEFVFIPRYNVTAAAGHGSAIHNEQIMHHLAFRKYWIDNVLNACTKDLVVIGVTGDSMEGEIDNGDIILINTQDTHLNNGIYVIRINGELIVKRIQKLPGGIITVISANEAYESFKVDTNNPPADFECIGRVVWHGRNVP